MGTDDEFGKESGDSFPRRRIDSIRWHFTARCGTGMRTLHSGLHLGNERKEKGPAVSGGAQDRES